MEKIRNRLAELSFAKDEMGSLLLDTVSVNDEAWKDTWKKYYKPFYAGKHLLIKPTWEPFDPRPDDLVIEIDLIFIKHLSDGLRKKIKSLVLRNGGLNDRHTFQLLHQIIQLRLFNKVLFVEQFLSTDLRAVLFLIHRHRDE